MIRIPKLMTVIAVSLALSLATESADAGGFLRRLCGRSKCRPAPAQVCRTPAASGCRASSCGTSVPTTGTSFATAAAPCRQHLNFVGGSIRECNTKMQAAIQCCIDEHGDNSDVLDSCIKATMMAARKCRFCVRNPRSPICQNSGCSTPACGSPMRVLSDPPAHCDCATGIHDCNGDYQCEYDCSYACYLHELCQDCTASDPDCPEECQQYCDYCPGCCTK